MNRADVERIKALAGKAPQGKWMSLYEDVFDSTVSDTEAIVFTGCDYNLRTVEQQNDLAAYIASLPPAVVAQLADAWLVLRDWLAADDRMAELCDTGIMTAAVKEEMNEVGDKIMDAAKRARDLIGDSDEQTEDSAARADA